MTRRLHALPLAALLFAGPALAAPPPLKIGLAVPLTGPDAAYGAGMRQGAEQAVADINRAGGIDGRKLQLVVQDDAGDPKQGVAAARKLLAEGVRLVVGHLDSGATAAATPVYEEAEAVAVTPGATWTALTTRGAWNLFRLCGSDGQQGALAGRWLAGRFRDKPVALVNDKTAFGRGLADEAARALKAGGGREALFEGVSRGERDFSDLVGRMRAAKVEAVYFGGLSAEAALLLKALREAGFTGTFLGSDGLLDKDFPQMAGPGAEGVLMTLAPDPKKLPEAKPADRRAGPPRTPEAEMFAARAYAAVEVLKAAVEGAHATEGRKLAEFLHAGPPLRTAIGEVAFDARGDLAASPYRVFVWRKTPDGRIDYAGNEVAP